MRNRISALTGAFFLLAGLSGPATAFATEGAMPSREIASVEPSEMLPSSSPESLPLFELGIGAGAALTPHYPGSKQDSLIALPFPLAIYRGEFVQSDRHGAHARLFEINGFDVTLSAAGAFPVQSSEDEVRTGMPDLGWITELGPKFRLGIFEGADGSSLKAAFSIRSAFSATSFTTITPRGFSFEPELVYQRPNFLIDKLDVFTSVSLIFGTQRYMDYLYGVPPEFATPTRAAYNVQAGFEESLFEAGFGYQSGRHKFIASTAIGSLSGATNVNSPLVKTTLDLSFGVAWIWTIYESKAKAIVISKDHL